MFVFQLGDTIRNIAMALHLVKIVYLLILLHPINWLCVTCRKLPLKSDEQNSDTSNYNTGNELSDLSLGAKYDIKWDKYIESDIRCRARCYAMFGYKQDIDTIKEYRDVDEQFCKSPECQQCSLPCNMTIIDTNACSNTCLTEECSESCRFLSENVSISVSNKPSLRVSKPTVVCINLPYQHDCLSPAVSIYIKWDMLPTFHAAYPVYVVWARRREDNGEGSWRMITSVVVPFVEIPHLHCASEYQFQVTCFLANGQACIPDVTEWINTPSNYSEPVDPISLQIKSVSVVNQRPSITVAWDGGKNSSCYFYLFWLGNTHKAQELKILRDFTWQVTDLEYSTNYSIQLYSYDETFKDSSTNTKFLFHMTPDCLEVTNYNLSICAPLRPENVLLEVTTPNHEDELIRTINVSLSWQPPLHTHNGHDVRYYEVIYSKKPPMNDPHKIRPDKGILSNIPPSNRRIDIVGLHNHNLYRFELYAVTLGGRGEPAELQKFIDVTMPTIPQTGLTGTELLDVIELRNATPKATYTERLKAEELLSIVVVPVVLFFVLFFVICFVFLRRRQKYQGFAVTSNFGHVEELNPIYDDSPINIAVKTGAFAADNYEIDYSCLDFISVIGEGAFGKVVKAEYYSKPNDRDSKAGKIVAVKMLRDYYTGDESRSFLMEIQAMKNLGHHPYIVSIIGCCLTGPKLCLVMDYCVHGDLRNYLRKYREKLLYNMSSTFALVSKAPKCYRQDQLLLANEKRSDSCSSNTDLDEVIEVSEAQLLSYARQITMGMEFLEQRKFVHRDLAARNILLFDQRHIKISDFGLTRDVYETNVYQPTSARKLPYKWMAIESLFSQRFTIKSDIWSFGIVLWEIVTLGGSPYPSIPLKDLYGLLKDGYRMEKPENCSTKIYQIMLSCWHPNAHSRPSFVQLRLDLEKLLEETRSYIDLTVEVSDDYFNESVNDDEKKNDYMSYFRFHFSLVKEVLPTIPFALVHRSNLSRDVIQNISLAETSEGQEYIESKQLCVDIHDDPRTDKDRLTGMITHGKEQFKSRVCETNDKRARYVTRTFQNNSVVKKSSTEMKVQGECSVCATSIDIGSKTDMCDSATRMCEICSTQMQLDKTFSYPKTAKQKLTSINSLKDTFKDIFETITLGSPKLKSKQTQKKSVSLTDIRNMGNVRTTAL